MSVNYRVFYLILRIPNQNRHYFIPPFVYWGIRIVSAVLFFPSLFLCTVIGKNYGIEHSVFIACIVLLFPGLFLFCSDLFHYVKRKKYLDGQQVLDTHRGRG